MKVTIKINNQDIEAEIKDSDVTKIVEKPKKKIRPEICKPYCQLTAYEDIDRCLWDNNSFDNQVWNSGNGFFTEEEAKKELAKRPNGYVNFTA